MAFADMRQVEVIYDVFEQRWNSLVFRDWESEEESAKETEQEGPVRKETQEVVCGWRPRGQLKKDNCALRKKQPTNF